MFALNVKITLARVKFNDNKIKLIIKRFKISTVTKGIADKKQILGPVAQQDRALAF